MGEVYLAEDERINQQIVVKRQSHLTMLILPNGKVFQAVKIFY